MLGRMTALELAEWQAYENVAGRLDDQWISEQFAEINELLQSMLHTYAQMNTKSGGADDMKPIPVIRPWELHAEYKRQAARGD